MKTNNASAHTELPSFFIRPLMKIDEPFLWEMLYQAIYVPEGSAPVSRDVLKQPEICRYVAGWGGDDDMGFLAIDERSRRKIGAAWSRLLTGENKGFGYVDDATPELSIAVLPEDRGGGVGTALLDYLLGRARTYYHAISLSVSPENPAARLYQRLGFETVQIKGDSLTMVKSLTRKN